MFTVLILGIALAEEPKSAKEVKTEKPADSAAAKVEKPVVVVPQKYELMISNMQRNARGYEALGEEHLNTVQVSFAYRLTPEIAATTSWSLGRLETDWFNDDRDTFQSGFDHHMVTLGARYQRAIAPWFDVYLGAEGLVGYGGLSFVDDLDSDDPLTINNSSAINVGGLGTLGGRAYLSILKDIPTLTLGFAVGYSVQTPMKLSNSIGELRMTGNFTQFSIGASF